MRFFMFHYRLPFSMACSADFSGCLRNLADCGANSRKDPQMSAGWNRRAPRRESRGAL